MIEKGQIKNDKFEYSIKLANYLKTKETNSESIMNIMIFRMIVSAINDNNYN